MSSHKTSCPSSATLWALRLISAALLSSCEPPTISISIELSPCLAPQSACRQRLREQTNPTDAACLIWEAGELTESVPLLWSANELIVGATPTMTEGVTSQAHIIFFEQGSRKLTCEEYRSQRALPCDQIEGCLLKLDSQPLVYEGGDVSVSFLKEGRCSNDPSPRLLSMSLELEDDVDNDCDGLIDERHMGLERCQVGVGACQVEGVISVDEEGAARCDVAPLDPTAELCGSSIDEDCDGSTDEGFDELNQPCRTSDGATGFWVCDPFDRSTLTCQTGGPPLLDESCDGVDDDGDGAFDEDFVESSIPCGRGVCQREGVTSCDNGLWVESCPPPERTPDSEIRNNGLDDDCDGRIDEALDQCDARDNDNDGVVDEDGIETCVQSLRELYEIKVSHYERASGVTHEATLNATFQPLFGRQLFDPYDSVMLSIKLLDNNNITTSQYAWHRWVTAHQCELTIAWFIEREGINQPLRDCRSTDSNRANCLSLSFTEARISSSLFFSPRQVSMGVTCQVRDDEANIYEVFKQSLNIELGLSRQRLTTGNMCPPPLVENPNSPITCSTAQSSIGEQGIIYCNEPQESSEGGSLSAYSYMSLPDEPCSTFLVRRKMSP